MGEGIQQHLIFDHEAGINLWRRRNRAQWKAANKRDLAEACDVILVSPHHQRIALLSQIAEPATVIRPQEASGCFIHFQICMCTCLPA